MSKSGCVWILSGSPEPALPSSWTWVPKPDHVVAADGGAALIEKLDLVPDLVVGDFDSVEPSLLARIRSEGIETLEFDHHTKNETDTELALMFAVDRWDPEQIVILGAIGGRLDHSLANVLMLAHPLLIGRSAVLVEGDQQLFLARAGEWTTVPGNTGDTVTVLPLRGDITGIKNEGFEYPLKGETLPFGMGRGVSNVLTGPGALWIDSGLALVIVSHAPPDPGAGV